MNSTQDKPKRWRPRWSVGTLVVLVTLICLYFGCWKITEDHGIPLVMDQLNDYAPSAFCPAPLVVTLEGYAMSRSGRLELKQEHFVWLGGTLKGLGNRRGLTRRSVHDPLAPRKRTHA